MAQHMKNSGARRSLVVPEGRSRRHSEKSVRAKLSIPRDGSVINSTGTITPPEGRSRRHSKKSVRAKLSIPRDGSVINSTRTLTPPEGRSRRHSEKSVQAKLSIARDGSVIETLTPPEGTSRRHSEKSVRARLSIPRDGSVINPTGTITPPALTYKQLCLMNHHTPTLFLEPRCGGRKIWYVIYRTTLALYSIFGLIHVVTTFDELKKLFIFILSWLYVLATINYILLAVSSFFHYRRDFDQPVMTCYLRIVWILHLMTLPLPLSVSIVYWSMADLLEASVIREMNYHFREIMPIVILIDRCVVGIPLYYCHVFVPLIFSAVYANFLYIYYIAGGEGLKYEPKMRRVVYTIIDFENKPTFAILSVLLFIFVVTPGMYLVWLKFNTLLERFFRRKVVPRARLSVPVDAFKKRGSQVSETIACPITVALNHK